MILVAALACSTFKGDAQPAQKLIKEVLKAQAGLTHISYNVHRVDTFVSGEIWDNKGAAKISMDPKDELLGFRFWGKRDDMEVETMYDGRMALELDHDKKSYLAITDSSKLYGILGFTGARMVMKEVARLDTIGVSAFQVKETPSHFHLTMLYPDIEKHGVTQRYKRFSIDKQTMLPVEMIDHFMLGTKKQSQHFTLTAIKTGTLASVYDFNRLQVPTGYLQDVPGANPALEALVDKPVPPFHTTAFDGTPFSSLDLKGKVVLLDFWETWCGPCVASMPKVQQLYHDYKAEGLQVLGIMNDKRNLEAAAALVAKKNMTFPMLLGSKKMKNDFAVFAVPLYIVIDKSGKIVFAGQGFSDKIESAIKKALKGE